MAFDRGSVSFRLFYIDKSCDSSLVTAFARHAAPPITSMLRDPISGWVSGRHLFDREITDEKCVLGSWLHVQLMRAEKKIPAALLRAHILMEEDIEMRAREVDYLTRAMKAEVKLRVMESLLPGMPPTLSTIPLVVDFRNQMVLAGALSDKQIETLGPVFKETVGTLPKLLTPETAALRRKQINANDLQPVSFSPDSAVEPSQEVTLGMDFLTWLLFILAQEEGVYHMSDGSEFGVMLEGPLTFFREGKGAHEAVLRKGSPLNSHEAATALYCGKKLRRVKVVIAHKGESYAATMDASFTFRALKLPRGEQVDLTGVFCERMLFIENFWSAWLDLYDRFLDLRVNSKKWPQTLEAMRAWIMQMNHVPAPQG